MGLYIYFYRVSSKEKAEEFLDASKQYDIAYNAYGEKYREPLDKASKKWNKWYNEQCKIMEEKNEQGINYDFDRTNEPNYDIKDFMNPIDLSDWEYVENRYESLKKEIGFTYEGQYQPLYMRKKNWMLQYVYNSFPERLHTESGYDNKILEDGLAILTLQHVNDIIDRMEKIMAAGEFKTFAETFNKPETNDEGWYIPEAVDWHNNWTATQDQNEAAAKYLPTRPGFFFGNLHYDYWYFDSIKTYLERFKKWRNEDRMPCEVLLYEESW